VFTVIDLTDSKYVQSVTLMTILMFYVCFFYMLTTTSLRKMAQFLTNEQHFIGTSLYQHPSSCDSILMFNGRFDFEQKRKLDEI